MYLLITDIDSDVEGILSATISIKTVIVSNTDRPRVIFSPLSGGNKNPEIHRNDRIIHGMMIFMK